MKSLILASSSKYRQNLLKRLAIPFEAISPDMDESSKANESPIELAKRLSLAKANKIASLHPKAFVIGSDQVAYDGKCLINKPGNYENAFKQLTSFSGKQVYFYTAISLVNQTRTFTATEISTVRVKFRNISDSEIQNYLKQDKPYDCAGSFKVESLGISLFESIKSDDPTSLEGLPLITLSRLLRNSGFQATST